MKPTDKERREAAARLRESRSFVDGLGRCGMTQNALDTFERILECVGYETGNVFDFLADLVEPAPATGSTSDGYHTFDELYHHRAMLFSVVAKAFPDRAWKSLKHADGTMYDGMFIVGIETPGGQATYHYDVDPYWGIFDCEELDAAPEWDGHTPEQAIERIAALADLIEVVSERTCRVLTEKRTVSQTQEMHIKSCSACGYMFGAENHCQLLPGLDEEFVLDDVQIPSFCPNCGAKVIEEES